MIIDEIRLKNFGVFLGEHTLALTPPSDRKPITLVGGLNGAGKTTLLEALQLALYGRQAPFLKSVRGYDGYLRRSIHRRADAGAGVAIRFRVHEDGDERQYYLDRTWSATGDHVVEHMEVSVNGDRDAVLGDTWLEQVERFIPAQLSPLFFFDGERIERLADPEHSSGVLTSGIHALLGVDLVEQLRLDLHALAQRKRKELKSAVECEEVEELEAELEARRSGIADLKQERARAQNGRDQKAKQLRRLESRFLAQGGRLSQERADIESRRREKHGRLQAITSELLHVASGPLPLSLAGDLLHRVAAQAEHEQAATQAELIQASIAERDRRLIAHLKKARVADGAVDVVERFCRSERQHAARSVGPECYLHLPENEQHRIRELLANRLPHEDRIARRLLDDAASLEAELDELDRKLAAAPDEETLSALLTQVDTARCDLSDCDRRLVEYDQRIRHISTEKEQLAARLDRVLRSTRESELDNKDIHRHLDHSEQVQALLKNLRVALISKHVDKLRELILDGYLRLLHKTSLVSRLDIDPETCTLKLYGAGGEQIPEEQLSAGERQLLAVAMLWGLARASGRPLPTVIDTPLGRLDATHRRNLVERYFPYASHQVLLLSTDEEIDRGFHERLRSQIGHVYRLRYDDETAASSVERGYFW